QDGAPARQLARVGEGNGVAGAEMIPAPPVLMKLHPRVARLEQDDPRPDRARIRYHPGEEPAEEPGASRQRAQAGPCPLQPRNRCQYSSMPVCFSSSASATFTTRARASRMAWALASASMWTA